MDKGPFKFLDSYQKEDIKQFFGRDRESKALFNKTFESNLILLYGLSGTGKTSLVQCGMADHFADTDWKDLFIRRHEDFVVSLKNTLKQALPARFEESEDGREAFKRQSIFDQVYTLYLHYFKPIYLIFDQFEELFILGDKDKREANELFSIIAELLEAQVQVKIILILREEYIAYLDEYEGLIPSLFRNRFRVERMRRETVEEVISKTVAQFDIELKEPDETTRRMIEMIQDDRGRIDLASLQIYLDQLYRNDVERNPAKGGAKSVSFDVDLVQQTGSIHDVLARFLDEQMKKIDDESKIEGLAIKVLSQLISGEGTKQPRKMNDVVAHLVKSLNVEHRHVESSIARMKELRIIRSR